MLVVKRDGTKVDYDRTKITTAVSKAYNALGENNSNAAFLITELVESKLIGSEVTVEQIQNLVVEELMRVNPLVGDLYSKYRKKQTKLRDYYTDKFLASKEEFIEDYKKASNAATGSKYDANANVTSKNIATMSNELYKFENIQVNRHLLHKKIAEVYDEALADEYIRMLESHDSLLCFSAYHYCQRRR